MVIDRFNMVDMEGVDLIESQGVAVPGLYQKLVESIAQCRYTVLYNWQFNKIIIPPTPVELIVENEEVKINEEIAVTSEDVIVISTIQPPPPPPILPVIQSLNVIENGTYEVPEGVDGFNPVNVNIPPSKEPKLFWDLSESLTDKIAGVQVTLLNGAELQDDGVLLPTLSSYILFPDWIVNSRLTSIEVGFGEMSASQTNFNLRLIAFSGSYGLIYRGDVGAWGFYSGSAWAANSDISDINYFSNSVLRVDILTDARWNVYKDDVLVYTSSIPQNVTNGRLSVGSGSTGYYPAKVKTIKIY